ncbi:hypothetical protein PVAND_000290 [Polypedilum vanderplanki]|uniref:Uncharacterized protein n=1 Tax=Polypedilum vanderplanki TaxID=319348 RepID=A0A9J6BJV5_POLVA|nr:hypothetical protein PVAND_000290 [Polypedilum vanderplanki]
MASPAKTSEDLISQRNTKTHRSPVLNQTPYKRMRSYGDENESNNSKITTFDEMKGYVDALSEQLSTSHKKDIEESNKIITTTLVSNIKEIQDQMSKNNKIINESINNTSNILNNSLKVITDQLLHITNKIQFMENNIADLANRVETIEKLKGHDAKAKERKIMANMIKQNKIENVMEIVGVSHLALKNEQNPKQIALDTIKTLKIPIDEQDIVQALKKEIKFTDNSGKNHKETRILVTFNEMEKKIEVMKMKSRIKDSGNIFFNISLTPFNAFLLRKAKQMTKNHKLKVFFKDNGVKVVKLDGNDISLFHEDDLQLLQDYINSLPIPVKNNSNPA